MPTEAAYTIADLARLSGLNVRTIRYYLAQGLIPASGESGPGAHYGEGHLDRLRLTRRLQAQHLPLAEIRRRLAELSDDDVSGLIVTEAESSVSPATSALDYIRSVLGATDDHRGQPKSMPTSKYRSAAALSVAAPSPAVAPPAQTSAGAPTPPAPSTPGRRLLASARLRMPETGIAKGLDAIAVESVRMNVAESAQLNVAADAPTFLAEATAAAALPVTPHPTEPQSLERSQWERLSLGPNIELHIRRPLSRLEQRRVERLITIARQVLNEDQS